MREFVSRRAQQEEYDQWLKEKVEVSRKALREGKFADDEEVALISPNAERNQRNKTQKDFCETDMDGTRHRRSSGDL